MKGSRKLPGAVHTDPRVAWFNGEVDRDAEGRPELLSVHLRVPRLMGWFYHDTFAHPVHHLHPKIPCYRVFEAQTKLDELLGATAIVSSFSLSWRSSSATATGSPLYSISA